MQASHPAAISTSGGKLASFTRRLVLPFVVLGYEVVDAAHSASLASLVMVSASPSNALHIFNERSQVDRAVALPAAPVAVAVDPAGKHAAVAYDANVSLIDLTSGKLTKTCPLGSNALDIVLTNAGVAYTLGGLPHRAAPE